MRLLPIAIGTAVLLACSAGDSAPLGAGAGAGPVVIELYQSQGCSSCPPANAALNAIAADPGVLALSFAVTYWDQLGWRDGFAKPEYTQRQYDYAHASRRNGVFTPQFVINGVNAGSGARSLRAAAAKAGSPKSGPAIAISRGAVQIGAAKAQVPATVWQVTYDPRVRNVAIKAGENGGRTLPHRNIVTNLKALGTWSGAARHFAFATPKDQALRSAIFVQRGKGGPIIAARKI